MGDRRHADGQVKNIENVKIGDRVTSWDTTEGKVVTGEVIELISPVSSDLVTLDFGRRLTKNTTDHPFYVKGKGWASVNPHLTKDRYLAFQDLNVVKLEEGDTCFELLEGELREVVLSRIKVSEAVNIQTYNFRVGQYHSYFANGILVHNK